MTDYGAKDLAAAFRTVRANTIQIAQDIPEEKYGFRPVPDWRSVAELLTHISLVSGLQHQVHGVERRTTLEGFDFPSFMTRASTEEKQPRTKAQIVDLLRSRGDEFARWLEGLSDGFLAESVAMRPEATPARKTRFEMIMSVKEHEMHHRGQLMLIERLLGVVPHLTRQMQERIAALQRT